MFNNNTEARVECPLLQASADFPDRQRIIGEGLEVSKGSPIIRFVLTASATPSGAEGLRLAEDVLLLIVHDGSGRLIDLSGQVSAVTESGASMLELALRHGPDVACKTLAARHSVAEDVIRTDLETLFKSLQDQEILVQTSAVARHGSLMRILAWSVYPIVAVCARRPLRRTTAKASLLMTCAFVATRAFGWANAVRVWERVGKRLFSAERAGEASSAVGAAIDSAVTRAIAKHPLTVDCKERALTAWLLARAAGLPARVQLGVNLFPFSLHCWCEHGSAIIGDRYEGRCDGYTPILTYG